MNNNTTISGFDIMQTVLAIDDYWHKLIRYTPEDKDTLIGLPHAYVVPSANSEDKHFTFDEMYYWDSYFIAQGLLGGEKHELAVGICENMLYMIRRFGFVPNANRYYFTGRSQPPLLSSYILDVYKYNQDKDWLNQSYYWAKKEYKYIWMQESHPYWHNVFAGLSRYYDINLIHGLAEAESGWDMTTRFNGAALDYLPIDLNCLLYKYEADFAYICRELEDFEEAERWERRMKARQVEVNRYMWNSEKQFFFDYNYVMGEQSEVWSLAAYYALWSGLATKEQADALAMHLPKFIRKGGLAATSGDEFDHDEETKLQWAHPNGWAPLHFLSIEGLHRYGFEKEARSIASAWIRTVTDYYHEHNIFREAYNVVDTKKPPHEGLYPPQEGFGWTNGVYVYLAKKYML